MPKKYFINMNLWGKGVDKFAYAIVEADLDNETLSELARRVVLCSTSIEEEELSDLTINVVSFSNIT